MSSGRTRRCRPRYFFDFDFDFVALLYLLGVALLLEFFLVLDLVVDFALLLEDPVLVALVPFF